MAESVWAVYMVQTQSGKLYTGITTDVARRFKEHRGEAGANKGAKFFRSDAALKVVYQEPCENRSVASKREAAIKKLSRQQKLVLSLGL
ncbi:GIY-YIG nuclease family protein [Dasania marina]|uniref:GIY-YIG nuclease family protein n=1 Tax=Dasania marina TaxID=471499 RepID=UPI0030DC0996|tara:strand:+ start:110064 stop:110330 length:267 start_codon:yes stop_codon:yes gene_type:complete